LTLAGSSAWATTYPQRAGPYGPAITINDYAAHNAARVVEVTAKTTSPVVRHTAARIPINAKALARMGTRAIGGPYGAAVIGAAVLAEIYWDDIEGWLIPGDGEPVEGDVEYWCIMANHGTGVAWSSTHCRLAHDAGDTARALFTSESAARSEAESYMEVNYTPQNCPSWANEWTPLSGGPRHYRNYSGYSSGTCSGFQAPQSQARVGPYTITEMIPPDPVPAPDFAVANAIEQEGLTPTVINNYFNTNQYDRDVAAPVSEQVWPELVSAMQGIHAAIEAVANGTATPEQLAIVESSSINEPVQTPQVPDPTATTNIEIDIPTDCDFHPTLCAWLEWFKAPEEPPEPVAVPTVDLGDIQEDFDSGLGAGSCPADDTLSILGQSINYTWQPLCEGAPLIRYLVIMVATVLGFTIVMGVRR